MGKTRTIKSKIKPSKKNIIKPKSKKVRTTQKQQSKINNYASTKDCLEELCIGYCPLYGQGRPLDLRCGECKDSGMIYM